MQNQANLILAVVLSLGVLLGFHYFYDKPRLEAARQQALAMQANKAPAVAPLAPAAPITAEAGQPRDRLLAASHGQRIAIDSPRLRGSVNLKGGLLDDLQLKNYHETPDQASPFVTLLSPRGTALQTDAQGSVQAEPYYLGTGWLGDSGAVVPTDETVWTADSHATLTPATPVTLTWDNGQGLRFTREIALDDNFMFTVTDSVTGSADAKAPQTLYPFALLARTAPPPAKSLFILHEGPLGAVANGSGGTLHEIKYKDLAEKHTVELVNAADPQAEQGAKTTRAGWLGLTDKYWLTAIVPDAAAGFTGRVTAPDANGDTAGNRIQIDTRGAGQPLAPGQTIKTVTRLFAGAKEVKLLEAYQDGLQDKDGHATVTPIAIFDHAVDFGWFYFLTKPYFHALDGIAILLKDTGYGFGLAILTFTIILKLAFFPIQSKGYRSMNRMRDIQPRLMELRERWAHDRQRLNMETFEMYRREKINPASGCWPMLVQVPVFFALYKVLYVTIEMRHAPFPGWIHDLSMPDPTNIFTLFGLIDWVPPHALHLGIWPLLMGISMAWQQRLSPPPGDPTQKIVFRWMPLFFMFLLANFPAGLVIYWTWSNLLGIAQQTYLKRPAKTAVTKA